MTWTITKSPLFDDHMRRMEMTFPDIQAKLAKFLETKINDPIKSRYGKHDRRMYADFAGFWHCHLRDDAILIYALVKNSILLISITNHAEIEGKRLKRTAIRLTKYLPT